MSYILDALKKSEQERNRGRAPDLRALHDASSALATEKSRRPLLFAALGVALAMVALAAFWRQLWTMKDSTPAITLKSPHAQVPRPMVAPPATPLPPVNRQLPPAAVNPPSAVPENTASQESKIIAYGELPPEVRRGMPEMSFAVHLYSSSPAERMVSINGKMMHEGQEVSPGLKLLEIERDGMVFSYQGYRFRRGVF